MHSDVWGPAPITSINSTRFYVSFIDDFSKFTWFFPLKHKSQVLPTFIHFKTTIENLLNHKLKVLRTDCGGEYTDSSFQKYCSEQGIFHQFSCPHTPQQNGVAERKHRHIVETALSLISQSSLPLSYWPYAFSTAIFLINRLPTPNLHLNTPWELLFHTLLDYSSFKTFGCSCFPLLKPYNKHKLEFKSQECVFLGYANHSKGYLCLDLVHNKLIVYRHVLCDEVTFPFSKLSTPSTLEPFSPNNTWLSFLLYFTTCCYPSILGPIPTISSSSILGPIPHNSHISPPTLPPTDTTTSIPTSNIVSLTDDTLPSPPIATASPSIPQSNTSIFPTTAPSSSSPTRDPIPTPIVSNIHPMQTRLKSGISKKKVALTSTKPDYLDVEPPSFTIAKALPPWIDAMKEEFSALHRQNTWSLVPATPSMNLVGCKWVYKIKRNADGLVTQYKARLVAKGFHQQARIDYDETFSPVVKPTTVRIILTLVAQFNWPLRQLDISNAFLHGFLKEDVHMVQLPSFVDASKPAHVCKLHKSLYGLKQAPRAWFERFTTQLESLGFTGATADPFLFILQSPQATLYLLLYVDDIIITGTFPSLISDLISQLKTTLNSKTWDPTTTFLAFNYNIMTKASLFTKQNMPLTS